MPVRGLICKRHARTPQLGTYFEEVRFSIELTELVLGRAAALEPKSALASSLAGMDSLSPLLEFGVVAANRDERASLSIAASSRFASYSGIPHPIMGPQASTIPKELRDQLTH
jgi:hypothetical protein